MKMTKRIFSLALCLVLMMALALPAFAAGETTYTLTIENEKPNHVYEAYQMFSGTLADDGTVQILSDIKWGSAIVLDGAYDKSEALLTAIKAEAGLVKLHSATNAASLAIGLAGLTSDSDTLNLFAKVVGEVIRPVYAEVGGVQQVTVPASQPAGTSGSKDNYNHVNGKYTISGLDAGYYLVKDKDNSLDGVEADIATNYIIRVLKDLTVKPKGDVPGVKKEINDTLDGTYHEHDDFDIGDLAYYKWEGTLPSNLLTYDNYHYRFEDTLSAGLTFIAIQQIYVEGNNGVKVHTFYDITDDATENNTAPAGITMGRETDGTIFVDFNDLLVIYKNILPSHKIVVKYTAMVNRDALIAQPNTNSVKLIFSNDPNGGGDGETPEDEAYAFTFRVDVDKVDADDTDKKLEGAEFVLYYQTTENEQTIKHYAKVVTEEMIAAGDIVNNEVVTQDDLGVVYEWTTDRDAASILDTDANGELGVRGLDAGLFYLEETKAPTGYNLMETPVQIQITPTYSTDAYGKATVTVNYKVDSRDQGTSSDIEVRNSSGSTLPITGGVGTTMFYVIGGILVAAAVVLLISRRRVEE